ANVDVPIEEKQQVLETVDLKERMKLVLELLNRKREILKLSSKIDSQVKGEMSKTQREYYLRQQLKAIKEELGELGEEEEELDELGERLKKIGLPPEVEKVANKELNRLKSIPTASSEYTVARTYLEWIADLPWSKKTEDNLDVENAKGVLQKDHYSLEKVKKRILEYLAVRKLKNDMKGPILPPLHDRMEVIELPGYTFDEKIHIARNHLIPKQVREHGLSIENIEIADGALAKLIGGYTREAGVRTLERTIADVCRAVAV